MNNGRQESSTQAPAGADQLVLSTDDLKQLGQVEKKFQLVRDWTGGVVKHYDTGFFLHGGGGVGKSFTVLDEA
jgi:hypothetical protein